MVDGRYLLNLKGGRYGRQNYRRKRRKYKKRMRGRGIGDVIKKGLKVALKKGPGYAKKFLNSSAGKAAKNFVRSKIGEKNYKRLEKGINIGDKILSNSQVSNLLERM